MDRQFVIRQIDVVIVAILGAVVLFLPGMRVFASWKEAKRGRPRAPLRLAPSRILLKRAD